MRQTIYVESLPRATILLIDQDTDLYQVNICYRDEFDVTWWPIQGVYVPDTGSGGGITTLSQALDYASAPLAAANTSIANALAQRAQLVAGVLPLSQLPPITTVEVTDGGSQGRALFQTSTQPQARTSLGLGSLSVLNQADLTYHHVQAVPSGLWTMNHPLNKVPNVVTLNVSGQEVVGVASFPSLSQVTVIFNQPIAGDAYLN